MVGVVQRGDADIATTFVRSDTMGDSPVHLGPALAAADTVILGTKLTNETSSPSFVTDVIYSVDDTTYWLFLVLIITVVIILSTSLVIDKRLFSLRGVRRHVSKIIRTINWNMVALMVDQEDFQLNLWSGRFLWFHFNWAILLLVFGYLWNTMSTDITVSKPATYIESIDYFFDTAAEKRRKPIAIKDLIFHTASQMANPDSKLGKLNHILDTTPGSYFIIDTSDSRFQSAVNSMFDEVLAGQSVVIYSEFMLNTYFRRMGCTLRPNLMTQLHTSKASMTPGTLHPIISHEIPRSMLDYLEYQVQTVLEFDLANVMLDFIIGRVMAENEIPRTPTYYKCMEHVVEEESPLKQFMTMYDIKHAIRATAIFLLMALVVLVFEKITFALKPKSKSTKTRTKPPTKQWLVPTSIPQPERQTLVNTQKKSSSPTEPDQEKPLMSTTIRRIKRQQLVINKMQPTQTKLVKGRSFGTSDGVKLVTTSILGDH